MSNEIFWRYRTQLRPKMTRFFSFSASVGGGSPAVQNYTSSYSILFGGGNEYAGTVNPLTALSNSSGHTYSFWMNLPVYPPTGSFSLVGETGNGTTVSGFYVTMDVNYFVLDTRFALRGNRYLHSNLPITASRWHHIVTVFSGGAATAQENVNLYLDGTFFTGTAIATAITSTNGGWAPFTVGARQITSGTASRFTNVYLDEVAVFDKVLTHAQCLALYGLYNTGSNHDLTGNFAIPAVHWWKMGDPGGQSEFSMIRDMGVSGNANIYLVNMEAGDITGSHY